MDEIKIKPIGHIKSCYPDKFGIPRQPGIVTDVISEIVIDAEWQPELALDGLNTFSHIWIIFIFHLNKTARYHAKVHPPRLNGEQRGVFATRSPHRPNPIGLSLVEIVKIENGRIYFKGGDLVEGTPVLDVKPYLPEFESKPMARGGWAVNEVNRPDIKVDFNQQSLLKVKEWMEKSGNAHIKTAIEQVIKEDPRPTLYKGHESSESPYRNKHAFRLYDGDIHFEFLTPHNAVVIDILF